MTHLEPTIGPNAVRIEKDQRLPHVARIVIDNPPVNAGSRAVRIGLLAAITTISNDPGVTAAILIGAGTSFIAGSDLREFGAPLAEPQLPAVIAAIEACPKPIVAAIHGAALGGGYEVALGCDARIATPDAVMGLPEVTLGMMPGAGGSVRLLRLVDGANAAEIILSGRRIGAREARDAGLIDAIASGDLAEFAADFAARHRVGKRRLRDRPPVATDMAAMTTAADALMRKCKSRQAAREAVAAIRRALTEPFDSALAAERAAFQRLRTGDDARALRHLFFAERLSGKVPPAGSLPQVATVTVIGAGTMGSGIASAFLSAGFSVTLVDSNEKAVQDGQQRIAAIDEAAFKAGRLSADERRARAARLLAARDLASAGDADLIVEAVFEDMAVKTELMAQLDRLARPDAVLASNTSYLDLDAIAAATTRPDRVVGLHFFSPAHVMRLVEVVRGRHTAPEVLAATVSVARRLGKLPVIARVGEGFIGNRIHAAYRRQCEAMLENGTMPEAVDAALTGFGFAMGPFAAWDLAGLDIAWRTRQRLAEVGDRREQHAPFLDLLCRGGRLGCKTGAGWYRYPDGWRSKASDPFVHSLIADHARAADRPALPLADADIVSQALAAIVNEASLVLQEGIAERASDIDLVLVNGYGFPAVKGGPLFWASRRPRDVIHAAIDRAASAIGPGFRRGAVDQTLDALA